MYRNLIPVVTLAVLIVVTASCTRTSHDEAERRAADAAASALPANLPLVDIMEGLETDLAGVAHGIWTRDPEAVRMSAIRIAEHPKVTPEQLQIIKSELGSDIGIFVQHDILVHTTALELAAAVDSSSNNSRLFEIYRRIEQGCMSCHTAFQTRVSEALLESMDINAKE